LRDFLLVINSNLNLISHRLATIHPLQTDEQTNGQTDRQTYRTLSLAKTKTVLLELT